MQFTKVKLVNGLFIETVIMNVKPDGPVVEHKAASPNILVETYWVRAPERAFLAT